MALSALGCLAAIVAIDVYLHYRVQNLAGVNIWGYRGRPIGSKQAGEIRIVALGGSTTFGYGLPSHESWPAFLEQMLNANRRPHPYSVVNLGAPGQGAYGLAFDLADYRYLDYDVAILYAGYNDLGNPMTFDPTPGVVNHYLWRRQSVVYRLTGYLPVLPMVFREKAMSLLAGGDLDAAYRGHVVFRPDLGTRATAAALNGAAAIADALGRGVGQLTPGAPLSHDPLDTTTWRSYTESIAKAVVYARGHGVAVVVVAQPYVSDRHIAQQRALAAALEERFANDEGVRYVNLGSAVDLQDRDVAYDGLHLVASANRIIAEHLLEVVRESAGGVSTTR
jgi:lysophospholipase L1-like esterase